MNQKQGLAAGVESGAAHYERLLTQYEASGLSLIDFAREHGLSPWTLYGWRRKLGRSRRRRRAGVEDGEAGFVAVDVVGAAASTSEIEVLLADGMRVRVPRDVAIARLVELVRALRSC
jgi:transposase-like protein